LVTLFLSSLAFSLIFALSRAQAKVYRHQQVIERFIVDSDACLGLLEADLATAFAVNPTAGGDLIEIAHLVRTSAAEDGAPPFNSEPEPLDGIQDPADFRGIPLKTIYVLNGDRIERASSLLLPPQTLVSRLPLLGGVNSVAASLAGPNVTVRLTLLSAERVFTVERALYAPGLATP
jgi:hypothetical protein